MGSRPHRGVRRSSRATYLRSYGKQRLADRLNSQRDRAESLDKLPIGVITVGAIGTAVGGVLLFMNRGKTVYEVPVGKGDPTRDGGGLVSLSGHF